MSNCFIVRTCTIEKLTLVYSRIDIAECLPVFSLKHDCMLLFLGSFGSFPDLFGKVFSVPKILFRHFQSYL